VSFITFCQEEEALTIGGDLINRGGVPLTSQGDVTITGGGLRGGQHRFRYRMLVYCIL